MSDDPLFAELYSNDDRYALFLIRLNKKDVPEKIYAVRVFENDTAAIKGYRDQVRNDLLKQYNDVHAVIRRCDSKRGRTLTDVFTVKENRLSRKAATVAFLNRQ